MILRNVSKSLRKPLQRLLRPLFLYHFKSLIDSLSSQRLRLALLLHHGLDGGAHLLVDRRLTLAPEN